MASRNIVMKNNISFGPLVFDPPGCLFFVKTKLNAGLALRQRVDLLWANMSANKISLPQGQSYTERKYLKYLIFLRVQGDLYG